MQTQKNVNLASYTSFNCGGPADQLVLCQTTEDIQSALQGTAKPVWVLGYGTNCLISDEGLPGTTLVCRGGTTQLDDTTVVAEAGVWWDDLVMETIAAGLWGFELMSGIPSSVGGAVVGNIAAYGQQISDHLQWVEALDTTNLQLSKIPASKLSFDYRSCSLQDQANLLVLRAGFKLKTSPDKPLTYGSALRIADELSLDTNTLAGRRQIILEARQRAGSIYHPTGKDHLFTAGSFFKNPLVELEQAKKIVAFDETGKSAELLLKQNEIHGGHAQRISAAHVMLAAGFSRGQTWGQVRLHPDHVLKIENMGRASAQEIYDVAQIIITTAQQKLGITLEPEVRFLGSFT